MKRISISSSPFWLVKATRCRLTEARKYRLDKEYRRLVLGCGKRFGYEFAAVYCSFTGKRLLKHTDKREDSVCLPERQLQKVKSSKNLFVLHHNHPSSKGLSPRDIAHLLARKGMSEVFAHGHDGSWYWAESKRLVSISAIEVLLTDSEAALGVAFSQIVNYAPNQVWPCEILPHYLTLALDKCGVIRYEYWLSLPMTRLDEKFPTKIKEHLLYSVIDVVRRTLS